MKGVFVIEQTLRDASRKVAAAARRHLGPHPSPDELIAYHAGELSTVAEESLQSHLTLCPECTALVLDLAAFPEVDLAPEDTRAFERLVPPWPGVHRTLLERQAESAAGRWSPRWRERVLLALAAGLFLVTVGLTYRVVTIETRSAVEKVRGDLPLVTLTAEEAIRSRGEQRLSIRADRFNLLLFLANPGSYERYTLQAVADADPAPEVVWRLDELIPSTEGVFLVVGLSQQELPPGAYTLELYGGRASDLTLLAEYQVLIEYN